MSQLPPDASLPPSHPVALEAVFFTRSIVEAISEYRPENNVVKLTSLPDNRIDVTEIEGQPRAYQAVMGTVINPDHASTDPYHINMQCVAMLRVDDTISGDEIKKAVMITAHSVLYGAIREAVAWLTGRQVFGPVMLGLSILGGAPQKRS